MGGIRNADKLLDARPHKRRPLQRCRWEDIIRKDIREVGCESVDWIQVA
jgi:hypothetical protein